MKFQQKNTSTFYLHSLRVVFLRLTLSTTQLCSGTTNPATDVQALAHRQAGASHSYDHHDDDDVVLAVSWFGIGGKSRKNHTPEAYINRYQQHGDRNNLWWYTWYDHQTWANLGAVQFAKNTDVFMPEMAGLFCGLIHTQVFPQWYLPVFGHQGNMSYSYIPPTYP